MTSSFRGVEKISLCFTPPTLQDISHQKSIGLRYIVREFNYSESALEQQRAELATISTTEKELWTELLRLARTNFSEAFQLLVHLKVLRLFVESVLRYGLPANYTGLFVKVIYLLNIKSHV